MTMITMLAFLLFAQTPDLTPTDVGQIVTASIDASTMRATKASTATVSRELLLDVSGSNLAFEKVTGKPLAIARALWLPARVHKEVKTTDVLNCPAPGVVTARCELRVSGTVVRVNSVVRDSLSSGYIVEVDFLQKGHAVGRPSLSGYTSWVRVSKQLDGRWIATVLRTIVG